MILCWCAHVCVCVRPRVFALACAHARAENVEYARLLGGDSLTIFRS